MVGLGECVKLGAEASVERTRSLTDSVYGANHRNLFKWLLPARMHVCSVVSDSATPWTVARKAPLSMGFSRQEYCSVLPFPFPGYFPNQGSNPCLLHWQVDFFFFYHWATWKPSCHQSHQELQNACFKRVSTHPWSCHSLSRTSDSSGYQEVIGKREHLFCASLQSLLNLIYRVEND